MASIAGGHRNHRPAVVVAARPLLISGLLSCCLLTRSSTAFVLRGRTIGSSIGSNSNMLLPGAGRGFAHRATLAGLRARTTGLLSPRYATAALPAVAVPRCRGVFMSGVASSEAAAPAVGSKLYDHKEIEERWQQFWEEKGTFKTPERTEGRPKKFVLDMFPYPSGSGLHVGHPEGYTASDVMARYHWPQWCRQVNVAKCNPLWPRRERRAGRGEAELASAAHAEVELLFRSVSRGVSDVKVSSAVSRTNGQRTFAFNGQKLPKHRFDHFLRTRLGIATGNPFWKVSQDGIHQLLQASPHALHDTLCEVSGTKAINAHRSNALKQLGRWKKSIADIQLNITALEEAVGREGAHLVAMDRTRELATELNAIPGEMALVDDEIARAELLAAERLVERLSSDMKGLEADKSKIDENLRILQAEATQLRDDRGGVDGSDESEALQKDLLVTLTDLAQASTEVKLERAALREKRDLNDKWGQILREARAERFELKTRSAGLRGRCALLKERRGRLEQEITRSRAQLSTDEGSAGGRGGSLATARRALDDLNASVGRAEARRVTLSAAVTRAKAEVEENRSQAVSATAAVDEAWERMRQIGSPLHTTDDTERYLRRLEDQRGIQRSRQLDLSRALESSKLAVAAASRRVGAPQWCSQLVTNSNDGSIIGDNTSGGGGTGTGHRGCLFELFELRQGSSDKPFKALASLLSSSLTVWVCESSRHADQALDLARANSAGIRVWPIERLKAATNARRGPGRSGRVRKAVEWAEQRWPGQPKVTDPASLLAWETEDAGVTAAMEKALGGWVITEDDEISGLLLSELGVSSVTASGVRHAPGEVIGGESVGEVARLSAKVDWDRAACAEKEGERALEACAKGCRDLTQRLESGAELARLQAQRRALKQEATECSGRLEESERAVEAAQQKLEWANGELNRLKADAAALGENTRTDGSAGVLAAMRKALAGREEDLEGTRAACAKTDEEIASVAEASMEAVERENNAMEALGANSTAHEAAEEHNERGVRDSANLSPGKTASMPASPSNAGGEGAGVVVDGRLAALKRSVESKIARVADLERVRDDLTTRVEEANAREKGAGNRLSALEESIADAKARAKEAGARLKDKRKSIKETERRAREAASKLGDHAPSISCGRLGSMSGESSFTLPAARDGPDHRSTERGPAGDAASGDREHGDGARAKSGASVGGSNNKENVPAGLSAEELLGKKHELTAKQKILSSELLGLRRQSEGQKRGKGRPAAVVAGSIDEVTVRQRKAKVEILKQQLESVLEGTRQLEAGVTECEGRMHEANRACYAVVREELQTLFGALCRNKSADIVFATRKLEDGLRLVVKNETVAAAASTAPTAAVAVERSPQELSGGQQALLGLALVLALSSYQAPPLCLLDEVDAALDETNQAAAARLVAMQFQRGQALCVSHHSDFHRQSGHCIAIEMRDGVSRLQA